MKKRILITGGSGFLGRNIIREFKRGKNFEITNLSRSLNGERGVKNIACDAENFDFKKIAGLPFDYIIHTLALSNEKFCDDFEYANSVNVAFTKRLLDFGISKKIKKFIHISSVAVYDAKDKSPVSEVDKVDFSRNTYSFTKGIAETYVEFYRKRFGLPAIVFRLSNIYGPYQSFRDSPFLVPNSITQALGGRNIEVMNLSVRRDWIYSQDAALAIHKALKSKFAGVLNLGSGKGIQIEDIIKEIANQTGVGYHSLNMELSGPAAFYCDISAIKKELRWRPKTGLSIGIKKTINYAKHVYRKEN